MKIIIDVQTLYTHERSRGIGTLTYYWLKYLLQMDGIHSYCLMRKKEQKWQFIFISQDDDLDDYLCADGWENDTVENFIIKNQIAIIHFTSPFMFDIDVPDLQHLRVRKSYWVYDLIPVVLKDQYYDTWPKALQNTYDARSKLVKAADSILAISMSTKRDLISFLNVPAHRVKVIYPSANENLYTYANADKNDELQLLETTWGISKPFIFSLSGANVRKNNKGMISSFSKLALINRDIKLVIGGIQGKEEVDDLYLFSQEKGISQKQIMILDYVSDNVLIALYKTCDVFIFPSLYEGFGIPVLEAMRFGAPVITSNNSSLVEVVGHAGMLVDPLDEHKMYEFISLVLNSLELSQQMRQQSLLQAHKFSWKNTAQESITAFGELT